mgnify:FL=1
MKNFFKTYKSVIVLLAAIIIGAIVGIAFGEKAAVLSPFGDIFLNLLFVTIVPLVFLSITTSISRIKQPKRLGKILVTIIALFAITTIIAALVGVFATNVVKLVDTENGEQIKASLDSETEEEETSEEVTILERTVQAITVTDFTGLLSKNNIIALVVFSILFGFAMRMAGEKAEPVENFLNSAYEIILKFIHIINYYAPIGLGCYFAALVGTFGSSIAIGYAKTFVIYLVVAVLYYFVFYTIYAFIAGGKKGVVAFWKNVIPTTVTALATCSSGASIPVNMQTAKKIGVSDDIANTVIPLGTSFHKDGSAIGSVFKIMFLVCLFATNPSLIQIILVALVANLLITAVPIGGGTISEMMILSLMGYPVAALPILTMIATIIDAPATVLNVVGDTATSMLTARIVDGKDWMDKKE